MSTNKKELFIRVIENNKNKLFGICLKYTNDSDKAKDLFQEVSIQIWKSLDKFEGRSSIDTWIYRICINVCNKQMELMKKRKNISFEIVDKYVSIENKDETDYSDLYFCINTLSMVEKSIITLHLQEIKYKEIAEIIGITENHVAVNIKRIKNKLLTCLKSKS